MWLGYLIVVLLLLASWGQHGISEHIANLEWMTGDTGADGIGCCGVFDCTESTVALLERGPEQSIVMVGNHQLTLPTSWVHQTHDGHGYWCFKPQATSEPYRYNGRLYSIEVYEHVGGQIRAVPP